MATYVVWEGKVMYCCKCLREAHEDGYEDLKMYRVPRIRFNGQPMGNVVGWETYCEECVKDYLEEEYRKEENYELV